MMISMPDTKVEALEEQDIGDLPTTEFEDNGGKEWTSLEGEIEFIKKIAERSDRVSFSEIGSSVDGNPIHLVRVGYPEAPTEEDLENERNMLIMGTPHGNEPAARDLSLKLIRDLAFTDDEERLELLEKSSILVLPTPNPDGREENIRQNSWGIDNNRDNLNLMTPENQTLASVLNQYEPDIVVDAHERPSGTTPDVEMLWPRNLNVDEELYDLNVEMVESYIMPDVEEDGFTTDLYGSPNGAGSGDERILRNLGALRHSLTLLTESAGAVEKADRVDMQESIIYSALNFYQERFDDIANIVDGAPERKKQEGKEATEPFYLEGRDDNEDTIRTMDPPACGYLLHTEQTEKIEKHIDLFSLETEKVSENGVFITMDQPMMTVIPLLLDERAQYNEVDGLALEDCTDPGSIDPPEPPAKTDPAQYETMFEEGDVGEYPEDWSMQWRDSGWELLDNPRRLKHEVDSSGGRRALFWDEVGEVNGDVEIAGLVRPSGSGTTMFQMHLHASGDKEAENSYYIDLRTNGSVRINRNLNGSFSTRETAKVPFDVDENVWYQVVFQRDGDMLKGKIWPYGKEEPTDWTVTVEDPLTNQGSVGLGHVTSDRVNEWAYFSVGTGGEEAARAPEDIPGITDSIELENLVENINDEELNEDDFTSATWEALQNALDQAEEMINDSETTQSEIIQALTALNEARSNLKHQDAAQYETDFSEYETGSVPDDWSMLWRDSDWVIQGDPQRLTHHVEDSRQALVWDEVGDWSGDIEVSGVVQANNAEDTLFQIGVNMSGDANSENAYYVDLRSPDASGSPNRFRINKYVDGKYTLLKSLEASYTVSEDTWYEIAFKKEGNTLWAKVWPYGETEPDYALKYTDDSLSNGQVGIAGISPGTVNDWAYMSVGTGGEQAPRAPEDLFDPELDKGDLEKKIAEIKDQDLDESDYTEESWKVFNEAFNNAEDILDNEEVTQEDVNEALKELTKAYENLEKMDGVNRDALQEKLDDIQDEDLEESEYSEESWEALQTAMTIAERVIEFDEEHIDQSLVDKTLSNLEIARDELIRRD